MPSVATDPLSGVSAVLQRLSRSTQVSLLLGSLILSLALLWWGSSLKSGLLSTSVNAIATGLLVSAAFGVAQSLVTGQITTDLLRRSIADEVRGALLAHHGRYLPTHEFEASDRPQFAFNVLMTSDLNSTGSYWYSGMHAKFCAARFLAGRNRQIQAHLVLPDPAVPHSIDARVRYRMSQPGGARHSSDELRSGMRRSMLAGLMGLFEARHCCDSVEILLIQEPTLDRFELCDSAVWVTLFSDMDRGAPFPRTARFLNDSLIYQMQEAEFLRIRRASSTRRFEITSSTSPGDFARIFEDMTGEVLTSSLSGELSANFSSSRERFTAVLGAHALEGTPSPRSTAPARESRA